MSKVVTVSIDTTQNSESGPKGHTDNTLVRPGFQGEAWSHVKPKSLRQCADFSRLPQSKRYGEEKDVGGTWVMKSWKTL